MSDLITTGDDFVAAAAKHFDSLRMRKCPVPELKTVLYYDPITVEERSAILKEGAENGTAKGQVAAIIRKALNAKGERMFTLMHEQALLTKSLGPMIERVSSVMMGIREPDPVPLEKGETPEERAEKN